MLTLAATLRAERLLAHRLPAHRLLAQSSLRALSRLAPDSHSRVTGFRRFGETPAEPLHACKPVTDFGLGSRWRMYSVRGTGSTAIVGLRAGAILLLAGDPAHGSHDIVLYTVDTGQRIGHTRPETGRSWVHFYLWLEYRPDNMRPVPRIAHLYWGAYDLSAGKTGLEQATYLVVPWCSRHCNCWASSMIMLSC